MCVVVVVVVCVCVCVGGGGVIEIRLSETVAHQMDKN